MRACVKRKRRRASAPKLVLHPAFPIFPVSLPAHSVQQALCGNHWATLILPKRAAVLELANLGYQMCSPLWAFGRLRLEATRFGVQKQSLTSRAVQARFVSRASSLGFLGFSCVVEFGRCSFRKVSLSQGTARPVRRPTASSSAWIQGSSSRLTSGGNIHHI